MKLGGKHPDQLSHLTNLLFVLFFKEGLTLAQAGLKLKAFLLPQPSVCWDYRREAPHPAGLTSSSGTTGWL